jgi:glycosyltransferase involved in cell wall biosynthesis
MLEASETGPRVSVVVASYNAAAFIKATLRSALDQSFENLEVLVIDDGSSDNTAEIVRRIAASDQRLRLIEQNNTGLAAVRNRGAREARAALVAYLDHDDLWHPKKLSLQVALLDAHPEAAVASCYSAIVDEDHNCTGWRYGGNADGDVYDEMLEWDIVSGGSVALVRRDALIDVGMFDETLPMRSDWDMWIRLARQYPFVTVTRVLVGYTRSSLSSSRGYDRFAEAGERILAKVSREDPNFRDARYTFCRARDLFAVTCMCTIDGETALAWRYLMKSIALTPYPILRRPRRWALIAMLGFQSLLPAQVYEAVLDAINRVSFRLPPGTPFTIATRIGD